MGQEIRPMAKLSYKSIDTWQRGIGSGGGGGGGERESFFRRDVIASDGESKR